MLDVNALPQLFSIYRIALTFVVLVPLVLGVAIAVVPLQLGARSLTFPRLAAAGFWTWFLGAVLVVISIAANGGPGGGDSRFVGLYLVSHIVVLLGLLAAAGSLATSVLTTRAPGMNMRRVPMFSWSALVGALGLLVLLPAVIAALIYNYIDYRYSRTGFGGNKAIDGWIGFGFTQPATFVYAVPVFGFLAEVIAVASGRKLRHAWRDLHGNRPGGAHRSVGRPAAATCGRRPQRQPHVARRLAQRGRAVRVVQPVAGARWLHRHRPRRHSRFAVAGLGSRRRWCSRCWAR